MGDNVEQERLPSSGVAISGAIAGTSMTFSILPGGLARRLQAHWSESMTQMGEFVELCILTCRALGRKLTSKAWVYRSVIAKSGIRINMDV